MKRFAAFLGGCLLLWGIYPTQAADTPGLGTWKLTFPVQTREGEIRVTFLFMLSESDGKMVGDVLDTNLQIEPAIDGVSVKDSLVKFGIKLGGDTLTFDGKLTKEKNRIKGSLDLGGNLIQTELIPSKLKNLKDTFAVRKETLDTQDGGSDFFSALPAVMDKATEKKLKPEEIRAYADKANKYAEDYGPRFQRYVAMKMANALVNQEGFVNIALEQARQAERMIAPSDEASTQMEILTTLAGILKKAKKDDEAKKVEMQVAKLELRDFAEYSKKYPPFKPDPFEGRKGKNDQVVLVELFTGAECPPCVAVDLAFDALGRTYKPSEVVFLQYHLHIPGPDPMTSPASEARQKFYGPTKVRGTPAIFFNGKVDGSGGGPLNQAKKKYDGFRKEIDGLLDKNATAKVAVSATAKGDEITIKANVTDLEKPSEKVKLRLALVEERIRHTGGNGLRYHHSVVRDLPGGAEGIALTKKTAEQSVSVKLSEVRKSIEKALDVFAKEEGANFENKPLAMKNLRVVAFVQDDESGTILQAAQAEIEEKKE